MKEGKVSGTPAKEIRKRFDAETVQRLLLLQWWNWPIHLIRQHLPHITEGKLAELSASDEQ